jgi:hypothetical protein
MKDRARTAKRLFEVQRQLHRIEELKFAQLQKRLADLEAEQLELTRALSEDGALHGLFFDMTVRRLIAARQEIARLLPEQQAQARILIAYAGRMRHAERLAETLDLDLRRTRERSDLEEILDVSLASADASLKQDR